MSQKRTSQPLRQVKDVALFLTVRRALSQHPSFQQGGAGLILLRAPEGCRPAEYNYVLSRILFPDDDFVRNNGYMFINSDSKAEKLVLEFETDCRSKARCIIVAAADVIVPGSILVAADMFGELDPVTGSDLRIACRGFLGMRMDMKQAEELLTYPASYLWSALRRGRTVEGVLKRLAAVTSTDTVGERWKQSEDAPPLAKMNGYGQAKEWGQQLAVDLHDWSNGIIPWNDVDRGVVLSGPPGVGKTIFAKSLAAECGVTLVHGSLGEWQAAGHLGDTLKAMRSAFTRAKTNAPAILFIDEIDSFGSRSTFTHDNKDYSVQVVNALLELLDGIDGREGVVVVAATNDPDRVDPAILRAGRLDQRIEIGLPNGRDRIAILAEYLEYALDVSDLENVKLATEGMTGADLAKVARDARRTARRERRPLEIRDVRASLPAVFKIEGEYRRYVAVHEAGHSLVGVALQNGSFIGARVAASVLTNSTTETGGAAYFDHPPIMRRDRQFYLDHIAVTLGGIAAEKLVFGCFADGGSSDLAVATRIATLIEVRFGLGETLRHSQAFEDDDLEQLRLSDQRLADRVGRTLCEEFERAKGLLKDQRLLLDLVTDELVVKGAISAERFAELWMEGALVLG